MTAQRPGSRKASAGYSIRVASRITGLSADTLRMWERRYSFPRPGRNASGARVYSQADVERLLLASRALEAGYRASDAAELDAATLRGQLDRSPRPQAISGDRPAVASLLEALASDEVDRARRELSECVATLGARRFLVEVAAPLVEEVGEAWARGRIAVRHEHLFSDLLSTELRRLRATFTTTGGPVLLLATLAHEQHGLGLEMVALYAALGGAAPRSLGVDTPADQIVAAARALGARAVGISVSASSALPVAHNELRKVLGALPLRTELWIGGKRAGELSLNDPRAFKVVTWAELDARLAHLTS